MSLTDVDTRIQLCKAFGGDSRQPRSNEPGKPDRVQHRHHEYQHQEHRKKRIDLDHDYLTLSALDG